MANIVVTTEGSLELLQRTIDNWPMYLYMAFLDSDADITPDYEYDPDDLLKEQIYDSPIYKEAWHGWTPPTIVGDYAQSQGTAITIAAGVEDFSLPATIYGYIVFYQDVSDPENPITKLLWACKFDSPVTLTHTGTPLTVIPVFSRKTEFTTTPS